MPSQLTFIIIEILRDMKQILLTMTKSTALSNLTELKKRYLANKQHLEENNLETENLILDEVSLVINEDLKNFDKMVSNKLSLRSDLIYRIQMEQPLYDVNLRIAYKDLYILIMYKYQMNESAFLTDILTHTHLRSSELYILNTWFNFYENDPFMRTDPFQILLLIFLYRKVKLFLLFWERSYYNF